MWNVEWDFCVAWAASTNLAETFVGLVKRRLDLDLKDRVFSMDELVTLLALAADSVNNRPLTYVSEEIDATAITANTLMKPLFKCDANLQINEKSPIKYRRYFEEILAFANATASRWIEDFSKEIKTYPKWRSWKDNIKVGDLVLVMERKNPLKNKNWPLGIVHEILPSNDNTEDHPGKKTVVRKQVIIEAVLIYCFTY